MPMIKTILREILGLFVDDGLFALLILAWTALNWLAVSKSGLAASTLGPIYFTGLASILIGSAVRRARA